MIHTVPDPGQPTDQPTRTEEVYSSNALTSVTENERERKNEHSRGIKTRVKKRKREGKEPPKVDGEGEANGTKTRRVEAGTRDNGRSAMHVEHVGRHRCSFQTQGQVADRALVAQSERDPVPRARDEEGDTREHGNLTFGGSIPRK